MSAETTTAPATASACNRAAMFGVCPNASVWAPLPEAVDAATTMPVAIPTRAEIEWRDQRDPFSAATRCTRSNPASTAKRAASSCASG